MHLTQPRPLIARGARTTRPLTGSGEPLDLLVDALATYRLTRLATTDVISEPVRLALVRRLGLSGADADSGSTEVTAQDIVGEVTDPPKLATLVTCRWCAGVWIAGAVALARHSAPRAWSPVARALALSTAAVLLARFEDE